MMKTHKENLHIIQKLVESLQRTVVRADLDGTTSVYFPSRKSAAESVGGNARNN